MPKIIELTVEIEVQRVSCPGVWLCQDGRVSLSVFALGTSYQTCMLPPMFPLMFKDLFYFRKRFRETCALNNICCMLKDETIYCELMQWNEDCSSNDCIVLAQYLGTVNDILFPPNTCSNDGVDLLMRRTSYFPGILSPKIEIATKVRIDEVWNEPCIPPIKAPSCLCSRSQGENTRQRQVCHTPQYHRRKCSSHLTGDVPCSRSRSRSTGSRSCCSLTPVLNPSTCRRPSSYSHQSRCSASRSSRSPRRCNYNVYKVEIADPWIKSQDNDDDQKRHDPTISFEDKQDKILLESRYVEDTDTDTKQKPNISYRVHVRPCVCEICKKYHELFHSDLKDI